MDLVIKIHIFVDACISNPSRSMIYCIIDLQYYIRSTLDIFRSSKYSRVLLWEQFKLHKTVRCSWVLLLWLSGSTKEVLSLGLMILHYEGNIFWVSHPILNGLWSCPILPLGKGTVSCPTWTWALFPSFTLFYFFKDTSFHLFRYY